GGRRVIQPPNPLPRVHVRRPTMPKEQRHASRHPDSRRRFFTAFRIRGGAGAGDAAMTGLRILLATGALVAAARSATAQEPVHWKAAASPVTVRAGGKLSVKLSATIDDGWHIYSMTQGKGGPTPL